MIILTGGAGFIGSAFLRRLNDAGRADILVVDALDHPGKRLNLRGKRYAALWSPAKFLKAAQADSIRGKISALVHLGACSSTTEADAAYLMSNNLGYSIQVVEWALKKGARVLYASSAATYGDGEAGYSDDPRLIPRLRPLNLYGWSKQLFDEYALKAGIADKALGLKFFNVFGPNEAHKGEMRSLVDKAYAQIKATGRIRLFKSHRAGIGHGEQTRDFIYVKDACEVMLHALGKPSWRGVYNLGTGKARNWNDLAGAVFRAMGLPTRIEYVPMPPVLRGRYQYHTQADMRRARRDGGNFRFFSLEDSVQDYVRNHLIPGERW